MPIWLLVSIVFHWKRYGRTRLSMALKKLLFTIESILQRLISNLAPLLAKGTENWAYVDTSLQTCFSSSMMRLKRRVPPILRHLPLDQTSLATRTAKTTSHYERKAMNIVTTSSGHRWCHPRASQVLSDRSLMQCQLRRLPHLSLRETTRHKMHIRTNHRRSGLDAVGNRECFSATKLVSR
ncbi:hypothetical protein LZ30DRAFT_87587 [Colletotrichum cereale]|nr:hypothetical protein LZ30DRAFT_87587 [Colletotrichum cereale]